LIQIVDQIVGIHRHRHRDRPYRIYSSCKFFARSEDQDQDTRNYSLCMVHQLQLRALNVAEQTIDNQLTFNLNFIYYTPFLLLLLIKVLHVEY